MNSRCSGCGAEVIWIRTAAGKKMPVDADPVWVIQAPGGKTYMLLDGRCVFGKKVGDAWDDDPDANVIEAHESHFATCPVGGQFRNRKPRTRPHGIKIGVEEER